MRIKSQSLIVPVAVGRLAAESLMDAGYERLLLLRSLDLHHVRLRCRGVAEIAQQHQLSLQIHETSLRKPLPSETFADVLREYRHTLVNLAKHLLPGTGILAVQSNAGSEFLDILESETSLRIPEELGMVVLDQTPPDETRLACVELNGREIGRQAVRWLHEQLKSATPSPPGFCVAVPPLGIRAGATLRQGEGVLLHQKLCQYFQAHLAEDIQVENVARKLGISRRSLEMKLKADKLSAPYELLTRLRLQRAETLLSDREMSIEEIAQSCGFAHTRALTERFRAHHGITPFVFRKRARESG